MYESAIEDFRSASSDPAADLECHLAHGICASVLKKYDEAIEAYSRALALSPEHPDALRQRVKLYMTTDDQIGALKDIGKLILINPRDADAYVQRAWILNVSQQSEAALVDVDKAIQFAPLVASTHVMRADTLARLGRMDEAAQAVDRALELDPRDEDARQMQKRVREYQEQSE
jgi:tetratricopeptide (TPR) repeat protein